MKIIKPSIEIIDLDRERILKNIELAGRTCYKSEDKITEDSKVKFLVDTIKRNHTAMLEFGHIIVRIICDRGVTHEIVRHRLFSFAQESTRYCNYFKDKYDNELTFIEPCFWNYDTNESQIIRWTDLITKSEEIYIELIENGATPQEARSVLPNSLKTEIVVGGNLREWIHFINLRSIGTTGAPHPQMKEAADMVLVEFKRALPEVFGEIK